MPELSVDEQRNENRLRQIHDYIRHTFQLFLGWFAFFAGINYVALGWLASPNGTASHSPSIALAVGVNFNIQNILGIIAAVIVDNALKDLASKASKLEGSDRIVPTALYRGSIVLIGIALFVTAAVWAMVIGK